MVDEKQTPRPLDPSAIPEGRHVGIAVEDLASLDRPSQQVTGVVAPETLHYRAEANRELDRCGPVPALKGIFDRRRAGLDDSVAGGHFGDLSSRPRRPWFYASGMIIHAAA